jgi:serine/threonine protein kinase
MAANVTATDTLVGRTLRDGILVREKLRETSVGTLYRAEDPNGLEVAVLVLPTASADSVALALLRQRFRRAIDIRHPNVASLHTVAETADGLAYVVAECLSGELLSTILAKRGALPSGEALDIVSQAAAGLQAAHEVRWVHGNISPETILLSQTGGGYPIVKLIGFSQASLLMGVAQPLKSAQLPEYASPERLSGQQPDERSDVFSLGAVLYHLLTGAPPTTTTKDEQIPESLQPVIDRALYPLPSGRFRTIADFAAALAAAQNAPAIESPTLRVGASRAVEYRSAAALVAIAAGLWLLGSLRQPAAAPPVLGASRESATVPAAEIQPRLLPPRPAAGPPAASSGNRPTTVARPDSTSGPRISPFRRAHPWVAVPGQRFYYRSSCPVALQSRDLLYFTSEDEARSAGYVPSDIRECR